MLALVDTSCDTSADGLLQTIVKVTDENDISLQTMCIADAFDGASNMSSQYHGLQAKLKELSPHHIHKWFYSPCLKLDDLEQLYTVGGCIILWLTTRIVCFLRRLLQTHCCLGRTYGQTIWVFFCASKTNKSRCNSLESKTQRK